MTQIIYIVTKGWAVPYQQQPFVRKAVCTFQFLETIAWQGGGGTFQIDLGNHPIRIDPRFFYCGEGV